MLAIIKTGGKQYLVSPGQKIKIEKINKPASAKASAGKTTTRPRTGAPATREALASRPHPPASRAPESQEIVFDEVLLLEKGKKLEIGTPLIKGAKVIGKILGQGKGKKVIIFKYKPKTRYKVKKGHRQPFTMVEILKIETP